MHYVPHKQLSRLRYEHIKKRIDDIKQVTPLCNARHVFAHLNDKGAPQFYIEYITAYKYIQKFNSENPMITNRRIRRKAQDFYRVYYRLYLKYKDALTDKDIIYKAIESHAPSFYISYDKFLKIYHCY